MYRHSYHWEALTPDEGRPILPKESVALDVNIPALDKGNYILEFDMISNDVCWFALNGSPHVLCEARQRASRISAAHHITMALTDYYDGGYHEAPSKFLNQKASATK